MISKWFYIHEILLKFWIFYFFFPSSFCLNVKSKSMYRDSKSKQSCFRFKILKKNPLFKFYVMLCMPFFRVRVLLTWKMFAIFTLWQHNIGHITLFGSENSCTFESSVLVNRCCSLHLQRYTRNYTRSDEVQSNANSIKSWSCLLNLPLRVSSS